MADYTVGLSETDLMRLICMAEKEKWHALTHGTSIEDVECFNRLITTLNTAPYTGEGRIVAIDPKQRLTNGLTRI